MRTTLGICWPKRCELDGHCFSLLLHQNLHWTVAMWSFVAFYETLTFSGNPQIYRCKALLTSKHSTATQHSNELHWPAELQTKSTPIQWAVIERFKLSFILKPSLPCHWPFFWLCIQPRIQSETRRNLYLNNNKLWQSRLLDVPLLTPEGPGLLLSPFLDLWKQFPFFVSIRSKAFGRLFQTKVHCRDAIAELPSRKMTYPSFRPTCEETKLWSIALTLNFERFYGTSKSLFCSCTLQSLQSLCGLFFNIHLESYPVKKSLRSSELLAHFSLPHFPFDRLFKKKMQSLRIH